MRIAFFTPVSPQKTGIADYSEQEVLPSLSKFCDIDIFIDENVQPSNKFLIKNFNIYPYSDFPSLKKNYDIPVYQMGNNPMHQFVYDTLEKYPGIVVLHDIFLHGFLWNISLSKGDYKKYIDLFAYCYGENGVKIAQIAVDTGVYPEFEYPLIKKIIDCSLGVICHSDYGVHHVMKESKEPIVKKINQPYTVPTDKKDTDPLNKIKNDLNLTKFFPIITSFGYLFPHKRFNVIFKAFKKFLNQYPDAILLLVGEDMMHIRHMISEYNLKKSVIVTGFVTQSQAQQYLDVSDICINLRYPTAGETSRSVLQIMASQKPVIVSNVGWFAELPDDACLKVDVDEYETETLLQSMIVLSSHTELRNTLGKNAQKHVIFEHNPDTIAHEYYVFMKNILRGNEYLINAVSEKLYDLNVYEKDTLLLDYTTEKIKELFQRQD
jgi:glycosyltransferase involved in cell wall biosynthesis